MLYSKEKLKKEINNCNKCCKGKRKACFYGNINSKVLFLAQNAGAYKKSINPDMVPFNLHDFSSNASDKATGDILKTMFTFIKYPIKEIAITNLVKCFIDMTYDNIYSCSIWLEREIKLMKNLKLIICLGKYAGDYFDIKDYLKLFKVNNFKVIMIWHPGYILRNRNKLEEYKKQFNVIGGLFANL